MHRLLLHRKLHQQVKSFGFLLTEKSLGQNAKRMIESILNLPGINDVLRFTGTLGFKSVAKKMGVKWEDRVSKYEAVQNELEEIFKETNNPNIEYPSYYFTPVHAYTKANLNWTAAYEAENALEFLAMARYELQGNPEQAKEKLFQRIKEIILVFTLFDSLLCMKDDLLGTETDRYESSGFVLRYWNQ